jgi:hypothetical protein
MTEEQATEMINLLRSIDQNIRYLIYNVSQGTSPLTIDPSYSQARREFDEWTKHV